MIMPHFHSEAFRAAWKDWQQHRKEIRHRLTPLTEQRQLRKLEKYPVGTAIKMIERSIENGWCGLFEVSEVKNANKDWLDKARSAAADYSRKASEELERARSDGPVPLAGLAAAFARAKLNLRDVLADHGRAVP